MRRLKAVILSAVVAVLIASPVFSQGDAEELPLADQQAFQAKQAAPQVEKAAPPEQTAPQTDQTVPQPEQAALPEDQAASQPAPQTDSKAPQFESDIPNGKALLYIYWPGQMASQDNEIGDPLVLAKNGPIGILPRGGYYRRVTETGTIKLWLVSLYARELRLEVVAGQTYYVRVGFPGNFQSIWGSLGGRFQPPNIEFKLISPETARTEIAACQELTE
jgi:hypothetical protein